MGFKCPICSEDFNRDQEAWKTHCADAHQGAGADVVEFITNSTSTKVEAHTDNFSPNKIFAECEPCDTTMNGLLGDKTLECPCCEKVYLIEKVNR